MTPKNQAPLEKTEEKEKNNIEEIEPENDISPRFQYAKDDEIKEVAPLESTTEKKQGRRRGVWRKIRVRPADGFETAESQHVGQSAYNVLPDDYPAHKFDTKSAFNSFTKGYFGEQQQEIETASALTMEKEPEMITEHSAMAEEEEEMVTIVPEAKIDATEEEQKEYEPTTMIPEEEKAPVVDEESVEEQKTLEDATSTTESIYDEVRKSLSELFSRTPEEVEEAEAETEETPTEVPTVSQEQEETTATPSTTTSTSTTTEQVPEEEKEQQPKEDAATEIAHVVELSTEPEVKANVTEINRSFVIATSTSQHVSHETEICYRGRCIKSVKKN